MLGYQLAVDGIPIDVLLVPIPFLLFAEKNGQCRCIFFGGNYQDTVVFLQYLFGSRNTNHAFSPKTRNDEFGIAGLSDILYAFIEDSRIVYLKSSDVGVIRVVVFMFLHVGRADKEFFDDQNRENDTYHT